VSLGTKESNHRIARGETNKTESWYSQVQTWTQTKNTVHAMTLEEKHRGSGEVDVDLCRKRAGFNNLKKSTWEQWGAVKARKKSGEKRGGLD